MKKLKEFWNDKYGMLIIVSWIILVIFLIIKLLGGNWFELGSDNEKFIAFCNFVDNTQWLKMILACLIYCTSGYFIICIMLNTNKLKLIQSLIFLPCMIIKSIISWYLPIVAFIMDLFILLVLTTIFNKNFKRNILCFIIMLAFQFISLLLRNFAIKDFNENNTLLSLLYQIDYYLMIALMYIYNLRRKEKK